MAMRFNLTPIHPINDVIETFVTQAQTQLEVNARTQKVFPNEIYLGFSKVNAFRKAKAKGERLKVKAKGEQVMQPEAKPNLSFFFQLNNWLHRKNEYYYGYRSQGINFLLGVTYKF